MSFSITRLFIGRSPLKGVPVYPDRDCFPMYTLYWKTEVGNFVLLLCHSDCSLYR
jgi:hypothetical protein